MAANPRSGSTGPDLKAYELRVSPYERVAGMLLALLALIGLSVLIMFILWLSSQIFAAQAPVPVVMEEFGTGEGGLTGGMQLDAPMDEVLGMETDLEVPSLENTLAAVADAVATQQALLDDPLLTGQELPGSGGSTGDGRGMGFGSGPGGSGRRRQWEVRFGQGNTLDTYARQLDFFGIELGVYPMPNNTVAYARNLASQRPQTRTGPADEEKRFYMTWRQGGLEQADRELLAKAGISAQGKIIVKFIPDDLKNQLAAMERTRAGPEVNNIRTTYFGIRAEGGGYRFYVTDQSYR